MSTARTTVFLPLILVYGLLTTPSPRLVVPSFGCGLDLMEEIIGLSKYFSDKIYQEPLLPK